VVINNRLFTPLTKQVTIDGPAIQAANASVEEPEVYVPSPKEVPAEIEPKTSISLMKSLLKPEMPKQEVPKKVSISADMFTFDLSKVKEQHVPVKVEYKPIISREAAHSPLSKPIVPKPLAKPTRVVEIKHELPITLVKGEIIYE
jgi:hypothetical protein